MTRVTATGSPSTTPDAAAASAHLAISMHFDQIVHALRTKPAFQRLVLAFAVGLLISCAANASDRVVPASDDVTAASGY